MTETEQILKDRVVVPSQALLLHVDLRPAELQLPSGHDGGEVAMTTPKHMLDILQQVSDVLEVVTWEEVCSETCQHAVRAFSTRKDGLWLMLVVHADAEGELHADGTATALSTLTLCRLTPEQAQTALRSVIAQGFFPEVQG